jgi:hypothetical protein
VFGSEAKSVEEKSENEREESERKTEDGGSINFFLELVAFQNNKE